MFKTRRTLAALAVALLALGPVVGTPQLINPQLTIAPDTHPAAPGSVPSELPLGLLALAGAIQVKDAGAIAAKFRNRAQQAAPDYAQGVQGAGQSWETNTRASEAAYEAGVTEAIGRKAWARGVSAAGAAKYTDNAVKLGSQRYGQGVANAEQAYAKGVDRFLNVIRGLNLPARGPKGSPGNMERANVVARALRAAKTGVA